MKKTFFGLLTLLPTTAYAEVADKVPSWLALVAYPLLFTVLLFIVVKLGKQWVFWMYAAALGFIVLATSSFIFLDSNMFELAIDELGQEYRYANYLSLAWLVLLCIAAFVIFFRRQRGERK